MACMCCRICRVTHCTAGGSPGVHGLHAGDNTGAFKSCWSSFQPSTPLHPACTSCMQLALARDTREICSMQVRIIEELALLNGSTFFSLVTQLGTDNHDAGGPVGCQHYAAMNHSIKCADRSTARHCCFSSCMQLALLSSQPTTLDSGTQGMWLCSRALSRPTPRWLESGASW